MSDLALPSLGGGALAGAQAARYTMITAAAAKPHSCADKGEGIPSCAVMSQMGEALADIRAWVAQLSEVTP